MSGLVARVNRMSGFGIVPYLLRDLETATVIDATRSDRKRAGAPLKN
jgi:hypothetical protein